MGAADYRLLVGCVNGDDWALTPRRVVVGIYLPLETSGAIFVGGVMKWVAGQWVARRKLAGDEKAKFEERGTLLASGFIAGEAIAGILLAALPPSEVLLPSA